MTKQPEKSMDSLVREIKKYNILATMCVRGRGSSYGKHERRCLWDLCGKPMMQWSLEVAVASKYIDKVVLSSEDLEILKIGEKIKGVTIVPRSLDTTLVMPRDWSMGIFQRQLPRSISARDTFGHPHNIGKSRHPRYYVFWYLEQQESFITNIDVVIYANEPLGTTESLDKLIEAFFLDEEANKAYSIYSVMPYIHFINPITNQLFPLFHSEGLDRQCYPFSLYRPGPFQMYGGPLKATFDARDKIAYTIISEEEGVDVHNKRDLEKAEFYLQKRLREKEVKSKQVRKIKKDKGERK